MKINTKEIRKKLNLTQREFAKKIGVSYFSVKNWEQGIYSPSEESKEKINKLIDIECNDKL